MKKPKLEFNEFGRPFLNIQESNEYLDFQIRDALKSISDEDLKNYKILVQNQKDQESQKNTK